MTWQPIKRRGERFLTDLISTLAPLTCGFYYGASCNQSNNSEKSCKTTSTHTNRTPGLIQHNAASFQTSYTTTASWLNVLWIQSPTRSFRVFWIRCLSLQQFQKLYRCTLKQVKGKVKRFFGPDTSYIFPQRPLYLTGLAASGRLETPGAWLAAELGRDIVSWRKYGLAKILEMLQLHLYHPLRNMKYETVIEDSFIMPVVNIIRASVWAERALPLPVVE